MSLKSIRQARGLSQAELARRSGVHWVKINQIESGKIDPSNMSLKNAARLADALDVDPREFLKN